MYEIYLKRFFDIIFSIIVLFLLSPLFLIIIIILKFTGEGEVFYLQERIGYKNKKFKIWKFVTMIKNSPNLGSGSLTLRNDPRVLPIGRFLRKTKINEFPQLINVLIGNMSFVGPRPQMEVDFHAYSKIIQQHIYNSKPGITGVGSIIFRDEESYISNATDPKIYYKNSIAPVKGSAELWYRKNISFLVDLIILFVTVEVIFNTKSKSIYNIFPELKKNNVF